MRRSILSRTLAIAVLVTLPVGAFASDGNDGEHGRHLTVKPDQLEWRPVGSMPEGAQAAVLEGNPAEPGDFTMRIKFPANYEVPVHTHPQTERFTVLEGTIYFAVGDTFDRDRLEALGPGTLKVMEPGVPMYGLTKDEPAVIQLNGRGPWGMEYVNPEDDPRR